MAASRKKTGQVERFVLSYSRWFLFKLSCCYCSAEQQRQSNNNNNLRVSRANCSGGA